MQCKVCQSASEASLRTTILGKYNIEYFRCVSCGFVQTEEPYWLTEAYCSAITQTDIGSVNRAVFGSRLIEGIVLSSFDPNGRFVDYGGGYGLLVRLMRDRGFDFHWQDRHCENLFARGFDAEPDSRYELLTAFEVFEHLADPLTELNTMLGYSSNLLFSTLIVPKNLRDDWWYLGRDHGQHIAFYTVPALQVIAQRLNLHLATDGRAMHLLSRKPVSERVFRFFMRQRLSADVIRWLLRRRLRTQSLLMDDFRAGSGHAID